MFKPRLRLPGGVFLQAPDDLGTPFLHVYSGRCDYPESKRRAFSRKVYRAAAVYCAAGAGILPCPLSNSVYNTVANGSLGGLLDRDDDREQAGDPPDP